MLGNYLRALRLVRTGRWLALLAAVFALGLAACGEDDASATPATTSTAAAEATGTTEATSTPVATEAVGPIEVTDSSGMTLTLDGPASRIVSHSPAATEILFAIGAGEQVVAADEFSNYPAEADALPKVTFSTPDPEQDLSFEPDLVIFSGRQESSIEHFRDLDLPVFFLQAPADIDGVFEHIRTLGTLTGHEDGAESVIADMQARLDAVAAAIEDIDEGPLVFYELTEDLYTVSSDSFIGDALAFVKARNVAEGAEGDFPQLSSEAVVEANPDVILMADADFVDPATVPQRAGWSGITAVVEDRIHPVDADVMSRPGPRIVEGIESLAALFYPDRFE